MDLDNDQSDLDDDDRERQRKRVRDSNVYQQFKVVDERFVKGLKQVLSELPDGTDVDNGGLDGHGRSGHSGLRGNGAETADFVHSDQGGLVGALSMALCRQSPFIDLPLL